MNPRPVGYQWLKEHFSLDNHVLTHASFIGSAHSVELTSRGNVEEVYRSQYNVARNEPLYHLEFGLKYDDFNLDFLYAVFQRISQTEIVEFVKAGPASKYARKIGFLYEFLTGKQLDLAETVSGNYADLLDERKYITGNIIKNTRWRINNNLLGNRDFCPIVRKTPSLLNLLKEDISDRIEQLKNGYPQEIYNRAYLYLFTKETRSSYLIEREQPTQARLEKFIDLLKRAGHVVNEEILSKDRLIQLQHAIVDSRYAAHDYRNHSIYVGQSLPNGTELIHYIGPPPEMLPSLMRGLSETMSKSIHVASAIRAALVSFGFVFIHPFEDGNGRIHRFLIHDIMAHDKLVPSGMIVPVSAHMVNNIADYDRILEKYSKYLMQRIRYKRDDIGQLEIENPEIVAPYFEFPDLTEQCTYLIQIILHTLDKDMPEELLFIQRYDEVKKMLQDIVDMPDKKLNNMLLFLYQNHGVFPKRRREAFSELTDDEIEQMQKAFKKVFERNL